MPFMLPVVLAMAQALAGPDLDKLLSPKGYPVGSIQRGRSAAALVRVLIDPDGIVVRCETMATVGSESLANEVCGRAHHRKVHPASDANGRPAWSQATTMAQFYVAGSLEADKVAHSGPDPDAQLTVSRLPAGSGSAAGQADANQADVRVVVAVDEQGKAVDCAIDPRPPYGTNPRLAAVVCTNRAMLGTKPASDPGGRPVRYVRPMTVRLVTGG
jgi:hypothetical protein